MADIFLSYARSDERERQKVRPFAEALEKAGFTVFWDAKIPTGVNFSTFLQQRLEEAKCVIVLWSTTSRASPWVLDEARMGLDRGCLVPILLESVLPPLGFGQFQALDFTAWRGDRKSAEFVNLIAALAAHGLTAKDADYPRFLIVEDEPLIGILLEEMLHDMGYEHVDWAKTEAEAIKFAEANKPDVVIMDYKLGFASGIDAWSRIKQPGMSVIFHTGHGEQILRELGGEPAQVLQKPCSPETLKAVVHYVLWQQSQGKT